MNHRCIKAKLNYRLVILIFIVFNKIKEIFKIIQNRVSIVDIYTILYYNI